MAFKRSTVRSRSAPPGGVCRGGPPPVAVLETSGGTKPFCGAVRRKRVRSRGSPRGRRCSAALRAATTDTRTRRQRRRWGAGRSEMTDRDSTDRATTDRARLAPSASERGRRPGADGGPRRRCLERSVTRRLPRWLSAGGCGGGVRRHETLLRRGAPQEGAIPGFPARAALLCGAARRNDGYAQAAATPPLGRRLGARSRSWLHHEAAPWVALAAGDALTRWRSRPRCGAACRKSWQPGARSTHTQSSSCSSAVMRAGDAEKPEAPSDARRESAQAATGVVDSSAVPLSSSARNGNRDENHGTLASS